MPKKKNNNTKPTAMRLDVTDLAIIDAIRLELAAQSNTDAVRQSIRMAAKSLKIDLKKILEKTE